MIQYRYFYIEPSIQNEIENALNETIKYEYDNRLIIQNFMETPIDQIRTFLLKHKSDDFELENKNENEIKKLSLIRSYFIRFISHLIKKKNMNSWIEICEFTLLYKYMITDPDYGFVMWFKSFILKNLEFLKENGVITSFLVICEFCPDFVTDNCYPIIYPYVQSDGIRASKRTVFTKLLNTHYMKWEKYMEPQVCYSISSLLTSYLE